MLLHVFLGLATLAAEAQTGDYQRGLTLLEQQRYTAAATALEHAAALEPAKLEIAIALAAAYAGKGDLEEAQKVLTKAASAHPDSARAQFELGNLYAQSKLFAEAAESYARCVGLDSNHEEARLALVKALLTSSRHQEALAALEPFAKKHPDAFDTYYLRGAGERATGDYEKAARDLAVAVRLNPKLFDAEYEYGFALAHLNRLPEAKEHLEAALQLKPQAANARFQLAQVLRKLNEPAKGEEQLREIERRKREDLEAAIAGTNLTNANELFDHGDFAGAEQAYREVLRSDPKNAPAYYNLSLVAARRGDRENAEAALRSAIAADAKFAPAWNQLGVILLGSKKTEDAERAFQSALAIDPHYAEAESNLGVLYGQAGRTNDAKALFRAAIEDNPKHARAYLNLGLMLATEGSFTEAAAELNRAMRVCGNCNARAEILSALQKIAPGR
jgi:tetratricopeptide (TPR) repeat protein